MRIQDELSGHRPARDGATLAGLSRALGHTAIATTARYLAAHEAALEPAPSDPWAR